MTRIEELRIKLKQAEEREQTMNELLRRKLDNVEDQRYSLQLDSNRLKDKTDKLEDRVKRLETIIDKVEDIKFEVNNNGSH